MENVDIASAALRLTLGVTMLAHGYNHLFGGGKLAGTARWFGSIGFKAPRMQAALASYTEVGAGALLLLGLLTPLAAAGATGTMFVAFIANHRKNGFFIFRPGEGYEYVLMIVIVGLGLGALGGGRASIDNLIALDIDGWGGLAVTAGAGIGLATLVLAGFWRPPPPKPTDE